MLQILLLVCANIKLNIYSSFFSVGSSLAASVFSDSSVTVTVVAGAGGAVLVAAGSVSEATKPLLSAPV